MTLKAVTKIETTLDPQEDFLRKIIQWYQTYRKAAWPKGNGHLGVSLEELQEPFERHFAIADVPFADAINRMLEKRALVLFAREKVQGNYMLVLGQAKVLRALPKPKKNLVLRFYLPNIIGRTLKLAYEKELRLEQMIREILHPTPLVAA